MVIKYYKKYCFIAWAELSKSSGTGNDTVNVTVSDYTGRENRTGVITAQTTGGASDTANVTQEGKEEFISITTTTYEVGNTGGTVLIEGTSNCANLKIKGGASTIEGTTYTIEVNEVEDDSWNGDSDTGIDGDPGASAQFGFKITALFTANKTENSRTHVFTIQNGNATVNTESITVTQATGVKTYAVPVIDSISYSTDIPAAGGSITPAVTYSQTWGWNGETSGGGTITSGGTLAFTGVGVAPETGEVSAENLDITDKERTLIATASVTVTLNAKTSVAKTADAYQEANVPSYGNVTINGGTVDDIPASGGSISSASNITTAQTVTYTSGSERDGEVKITYSATISATSLGTTVTSRTKKGVLTATATGEGEETATKSFDIYQAANTATYGEVTITLASPISLQADGQVYEINPQAKQTVTYTSGASRNEASSDNPVQISSSYEVKTPQTGFQLAENTVTVAANPTVDPRGGFVVTITSTGEGEKSAEKEITFNQQGSASTIQLSPDTLTFTSEGGVKELTVTSSDSWTLS